jgi:hypothetical protein
MPREYISVETKRQVDLRAHHCCEYCKSSRNYAAHTFHIEHIIPISAGGKTSLDNLALACANCNGSKSNRMQATDPVSKTTVDLFHPRQQEWNRHFAWSADFLEIIGTTPTGRATVETLKLNRQEVVNLRRALRKVGIHPFKTEE